MTDRILLERSRITEVINENSLCAYFNERAHSHPESPALSWQSADSHSTITWKEYREKVLQIAAALVTLDVEKGAAVAIMASNRPEHMIVDMAAAHCSAVSTTLYATLSAEQLDHIVADCEPRVIFVEGVPALNKILALPAVAVCNPCIVWIPAPGEGNSLNGDPSHVLKWTDIEARGFAADNAVRTEVERRWSSVRSTDALTYIYTSGTTGRSKGVILSHGNVMYVVEAMRSFGYFDFAYRYVSYLPFAHIAERVMTIYIPLRFGGHVACCPNQTDMVEYLQRYKPTFFFGVPRVWEKLRNTLETVIRQENDDELLSAIDLARNRWQLQNAGLPVSAELQMQFDKAETAILRGFRAKVGLDACLHAGSSAAPLNPNVASFFASIGLPILEGYGLTETAGPAVGHKRNKPNAGSLGEAFPGVELKIAEDGEILLRGPMNTIGYRNLPHATAELLSPDGWLRSGDLGLIDERGRLRITGRKKELIINASGKNIAPTAIEQLINGQSFISQALAYGDAKPYLTALLTVNAQKLIGFAEINGISERRVDRLIELPPVLAEAQRVLDEANAKLSRPEQIKRFSLLAMEWTVETEELTPTQKLRRSIVHAKYAHIIERMYEKSISVV